jgi:hypothetical protein
MSSPHEVFRRFLEATRRAKQRRAAERHGRRLELAMQKAFRKQGKLFVQGMGKQLRHFFTESISPNDWLPLWMEVTQKTVKFFAGPLDKAAAEALKLGAVAAIGDVGMDISFSLANPRAVKYLKDYGALRVAGIDETTRGTLQKILAQAADEGWSYSRTAEVIIGQFNEFAVGRPQGHIDSRAHMIAVTEIGEAYSEGNFIVAQELEDAGLTMEKSWSTVGDGKVNQEICAANEAQGWIPLKQAYQSGHMRPLGHPGCRCDQLVRRKS